MATGGPGARDIELPLTTTSHEGTGQEENNPMKDIIDRPWANTCEWYFDLCCTTLLGAFLGLISIPYMRLVDEVPHWWLKKLGPKGFPDDISTLGYRGGEATWVYVFWLGATAVGVLKALVGLDKYPSFITEVKHQHVEPWTAAKVCVCCIASLCAGAVAGPEAGLGSAGAACGYLLYLAVRRVGSQEPTRLDMRRRNYIVAGICGAFGAILPAPFIAVLLVAEISKAGTEQHVEEGEYMPGRQLSRGVLTILVPCATFAFVVRYCVEPLPTFPNPGVQHPYHKWSPIVAIGLGHLAALVGLFFLIVGAIIKKLLDPLASFLERCFGVRVRIIAMCSLAGAVTGVICCLFPLCIGSGRDMLPTSIKNTHLLDTWVIVGIFIGKCLAYWVGAHGGLVGGMFFPLIFFGEIGGELISSLLGTNRFETVLVMLAAVPASFITVPLTGLSLPVGMFVTGPLHTVYAFIGIVVSNTLLVGTGLLQKIAKGRGS